MSPVTITVCTRLRRGLPGEGAQDVVRLEAVLLVDGDAEGPHDLAHAPELVAQVVRDAGPVGLVVDRGQVAEGGVERSKVTATSSGWRSPRTFRSMEVKP